MKSSYCSVAVGGSGSVVKPHVGRKGLRNKRRAAHRRQHEIDMLRKQLIQDRKEEMYGIKPKPYSPPKPQKEHGKNNKFGDMDWGRL